MKWKIPAKTFLVGEYVAVAGKPAVLLTTTPCFELKLREDETVTGIHPDSPAGQWWAQNRIPNMGLEWADPYQGLGGLGASSAQFLGVYLALCHLLQVEPSYEKVLEAYYQCAWSNEGLKPSGYDLLSQSERSAVYIDKERKIVHSYEWVFDDIAFLLLHSGKKLATHDHLKNTHLPSSLFQLTSLVEQARYAFETRNSEPLIAAVNSYQSELEALQLVAEHSSNYVKSFQTQPDILAAKGCGAMGSDVLLLIIPKDKLQSKTESLSKEGWTILASSENLYLGNSLLTNKPDKTLEILP